MPIIQILQEMLVIQVLLISLMVQDLRGTNQVGMTPLHRAVYVKAGGQGSLIGPEGELMEELIKRLEEYLILKSKALSLKRQASHQLFG